jgi:hypothetical protein
LPGGCLQSRGPSEASPDDSLSSREQQGTRVCLTFKVMERLSTWRGALHQALRE